MSLDLEGAHREASGLGRDLSHVQVRSEDSVL